MKKIIEFKISFQDSGSIEGLYSNVDNVSTIDLIAAKYFINQQLEEFINDKRRGNQSSDTKEDNKEE